MKKHIFFILILLSNFLIITPTSAEYTFEMHHDICVFGGTAGGYTACMSAWKEEKSVGLITQDLHDYGMMAGGLSGFDIGSNITNHGGYFREMSFRILAHYFYYNPLYAGYCYEGRAAEPQVVKRVLDKMLEDSIPESSNIMPFFYRNYTLESVSTFEENGKTKIEYIIIYDNLDPNRKYKIYANFFIDASYEQDLMAMAGVPYTIGRESRDTYGEWLAGDIEAHGGRGLLEQRSTGEADTKLPSYNYRLIVKRNGTGIDFSEPDPYDPSEFLEIVNFINTNNVNSLTSIFNFHHIPNDKYDMNNIVWCWQSTDWFGHSWDYPEADKETRKQIALDHKNYMLRLFHFLKTSEDIPQTIRDQMSQVKLTEDEFIEYGGWSPQLYVREGRRMLGAYVMTQHDVVDPRYQQKDDPICLGTYMIDCHSVDTWDHWSGYHMGRGLIIMPRYHRCYQIPYRSIYSNTHSNFFSAFGISASHVAFCSIRMEPQFMHLGQAAGIAASIAIDNSISDVADVPYPILKSKLESNKHFVQVLTPNDPFSADNWAPDVNEIITLTRGLKANWGPVKWDFDGNGTVDADNEDVVKVKFPENKVYRVSIRASRNDIDMDRSVHSYAWLFHVGNKITAQPEMIWDNHPSYAKPDETYWKYFTTHQGFLGDGYYIDNNQNKGIAYYEYPITVSESNFYDISLLTLQDEILYNYADNVPVDIVSTDLGTVNVEFDQTLVTYEDDPFKFRKLATVFLEAGKIHYVRIKNDNTTARVMADACSVVLSGTWYKDNEGVYCWQAYTGDLDNDGMEDTWEASNSLNPLIDDANMDSDNDNLTNVDEYQYLTDPQNPDTDQDGQKDGDEIAIGTDPLDRYSVYAVYDIECIDTGIKISWLPIGNNEYRVYWHDPTDEEGVWHTSIEEQIFFDDLNNGTMYWFDLTTVSLQRLYKVIIIKK